MQTLLLDIELELTQRYICDPAFSPLTEYTRLGNNQKDKKGMPVPATALAQRDRLQQKQLTSAVATLKDHIIKPKAKAQQIQNCFLHLQHASQVMSRSTSTKAMKAM